MPNTDNTKVIKWKHDSTNSICTTCMEQYEHGVKVGIAGKVPIEIPSIGNPEGTAEKFTAVLFVCKTSITETLRSQKS